MRSRRVEEGTIGIELEKHVMNAKWKNEAHEIGVWHLLAAKSSLLEGAREKVRSILDSKKIKMY
jgi:hypothetical protein